MRNHYHRSRALPFSDYHPPMQQCLKRIWRLRDREHWRSYLKGLLSLRASQPLSNSISWTPLEAHPCWAVDSHKTWEVNTIFPNKTVSEAQRSKLSKPTVLEEY